MNLVAFKANSGINEPEVAQKIKGFMALVVVLGHIAPFMSSIYYVMSGAIAVGVFFYYSAYGSEISFLTKKNYLDNFLGKKIFKLYVPYFIANLVYLISEVCQSERPLNLNIDLLFKFFGLYLANPVLWYIQHLILFLLIFYVVKKIVSRQYHLSIYVTIYLCYILVAVLYDIPVWWYISTSSLLIGSYFSVNRVIPRFVLNSIFCIWIILVVLGEIYAIFGVQVLSDLQFFQISPNYYAVGLIMLIVPLFCLVMRCFCDEKVFQVKDSVLVLLGTCSYEIYLYHLPVKLWVESYLSPKLEYLSVPLIIFITIALSYAMKKIHMKIYKWYLERFAW